jgi:hypothetical protein
MRKSNAVSTFAVLAVHYDSSRAILFYLRVLVSQYSETNVMHFLFNLLRIKFLYMFRALLAPGLVWCSQLA